MFFFLFSEIFILKNLFIMQFLLLNFPQPTLSFPITAVILFALICMTYSMAEDKIHFEDFKKITHRKMSFSTPTTRKGGRGNFTPFSRLPILLLAANQYCKTLASPYNKFVKKSYFISHSNTGLLIAFTCLQNMFILLESLTLKRST